MTETCETCERSSNHNAPYLTCSWLSAFVQHDKVACDHYLPHALIEADAQVIDKHDIHLKPGRVVV